jgi:hypothetical protein
MKPAPFKQPNVRLRPNYIVELNTDDQEQIEKFKKKFEKAMSGSGDLYIPFYVAKITEIGGQVIYRRFKKWWQIWK